MNQQQNNRKKEFDSFQQEFLARSQLPSNALQKTQNLFTTNGLCVLFIHDRCQNLNCPYLHDSTKIRACDHFLRGSCNKGEDCHFSHNIHNYTICQYLLSTGKCNKENCKFKHVLQPCRDYDKGFCINGKQCYYSHIPKKLCLNYTYGFCPLGPQCQDAHPKIFNDLDIEFLKSVDKLLNMINFTNRELKIVRCDNKMCKEIGHKTPDCIMNQEIPLNSIFYCFKCKGRHMQNMCLLKDNNQ